MEQYEKGDLGALTYGELYARLRSAAKRAGPNMDRVHSQRPAHAGTTILRQTKNIKAAQQLLGRRDIKSTMRYAHVLTHDLRAALEDQVGIQTVVTSPEAEFAAPKQRRKKS